MHCFITLTNSVQCTNRQRVSLPHNIRRWKESHHCCRWQAVTELRHPSTVQHWHIIMNSHRILNYSNIRAVNRNCSRTTSPVLLLGQSVWRLGQCHWRPVTMQSLRVQLMVVVLVVASLLISRNGNGAQTRLVARNNSSQTVPHRTEFLDTIVYNHRLKSGWCELRTRIFFKPSDTHQLLSMAHCSTHGTALAAY